MSFVGSGEIVSVEASGVDGEGRQTWRAAIRGYHEFVQPVPKQDGAPPRWNPQNSISRISDDDFNRIVALGGAQRREPRPLTVVELESACSAEGLVLVPETLRALVAALTSGKHVILTGPPGTAKTRLAVLVATLATTNDLASGHLLTTATADWSTYDTIGGLAPTESGLIYRPGRFIEALESDLWLIVDEMNRSNFDRAFGQLFTVLAGTDVTLPYDDAHSGLPVRIRQASSAPSSQYHDVVLGRHWRMIGTINNFDKSLLFDMSFALMRRFAFVEVPAPDEQTYRRLIRDAAEHNDAPVTELAEKATVSLLRLRRLQELGPAIFIDAARMARELAAISPRPSRGEIAFTIFYAMLLPQFEGIEETTGRQFLRSLTTVCGPDHERQLRRVLREVLGLELAESLDEDGDEAGTEGDTDGYLGLVAEANDAEDDEQD